MTTLQTDYYGFVYVRADGVEQVFTNRGSWIVGSVTNMSLDLHPSFDVNMRPDGYIVVDSIGTVRLHNGPDLIEASRLGFTMAVGGLGLVLVIKWAVSFFQRSSGVKEIGQ